MTECSDFHALPVGAEPAIEVAIGGRWLPGTLRSWIRRDTSWWAHIDYTVGPDRTHTTTVPAQRIRSTDPSGQAPTCC